MEDPIQIRQDCYYFNGYKPCKFHKETGIYCAVCKDYRPIGKRILILKVGAAGEVIRNTPLLRRIRSMWPDAEITWVTNFPEFVPKGWVNYIFRYDWQSINRILNKRFDLLLSLDKDHDVCAVANRVSAQTKKGFLLDPNGRIIPADEDAKSKWLTGILDDLMRQNRKHYVEELFEICGWKWEGEKYILEGIIIPKDINLQRNNMVAGLNTGAGSIWPTRIWPEKHWQDLIIRLKQSGFTTLLLGGPDEDQKNKRLAKETGALYFGVRPYLEFAGIISYCDLVVTAVTMALHIAIALEKKIVLFNNIFNKHEFHLYGKGKIIEPLGLSCLGCYKQKSDEFCPVKNCSSLIQPSTVYKTINEFNISST